MKAVYSFLFPETFAVLSQVESLLKPELLRTQTSAKRAEELLAAHFPGLIVPATARGKIDLYDVHKPIVERIMRAYAGQTVGLGDFTYVYPTSGSSEGIYHLLTRVAREGTTTINTLVGEYEGYREQGKNVGLSTKEWEIDDPAISKLPAGSVWFLSNPCARDGNILPDEFLAMLCHMGHKLVLDLAYVGATAPHCFDLTHENVMAVVTSFSKPYGTFRLRIGGMTFAREQMPTLYGNKWFKDVQRLFQALALTERIGPEGLYPKYRPVQESIVSALNERFNLELLPADALLLALLPAAKEHTLPARWREEQRHKNEKWTRGSTYRFCLTPYFEDACPLSNC
jgi:hypothetical protein